VLQALNPNNDPPTAKQGSWKKEAEASGISDSNGREQGNRETPPCDMPED